MGSRLARQLARQPGSQLVTPRAWLQAKVTAMPLATRPGSPADSRPAWVEPWSVLSSQLAVALSERRR
jgi:hypothetical protein